MPEMVAPRALVFRPLVKGNEDSGNEIGFSTVQITVQYRCIFVLLFGRYSLQLDNNTPVILNINPVILNIAPVILNITQVILNITQVILNIT